MMKGADMAITAQERRQAMVEARRVELQDLAARGVRAEGNGFSQILLVKGALNEQERAGAPLLSGADGTALRAALLRLGYPPEDFCVLSAVTGEGDPGVVPTTPPGAPLAPALFREVVEALDPEAGVLLDDAATDAMREAYAEALSLIEQFEVAMLAPGLVAYVAGRRVLALDGFEAALADAAAKQRMWAYLKQLPPAGAPY